MLKLSKLNYLNFGLFLVTGFFASLILMPQKANAAVIENGGWIPNNLQIPNVYPNGSCAPLVHAQANWISPAGQSTLMSAYVPYGTTNLPLQWQYSSGICNNGLDGSGNVSNSARIINATYAITTGSSISGVSVSTGAAVGGLGVSIGSPSNIAFGYNYSYRYAPLNQAPVPINATLPNNLAPGDYIIRVTVRNKSAHNFTNNAPGEVTCIVDGGAIIKKMNINDCPEGGPPIPIFLTVGARPDNPPVGTPHADCDTFWMFDTQDPDVPDKAVEFELWDMAGNFKVRTTAAASDNRGWVSNLQSLFKPGDTIRVIIYNYRADGTRDQSRDTGINHKWDYRENNPAECNNPLSSQADVNVQAQFDDDEDPGEIEFSNMTINFSGNLPFSTKPTRRFYVIRGNNPPANITNLSLFTPSNISQNPTNDPNVSSNKTFDVTKIDNPISRLNLNAGDQVCVSMTVNPGSVNISNTGVVSNGPPKTAIDCDTIVNRPFVSFYGGDVSTGGDFAGGNCAYAGDGIETFNNNASRGSGVQFAARAMASIDTITAKPFASARLTLKAPSGLTFANRKQSGVINGDYGGTHCVPDYFVDSSTLTPLGSNSITATNINANKSLLFQGTSNYSLGSGADITLNKDANSNKGNRTIIYVDGNLLIKDNIKYGDTTWGSLDEIPSLHIHVRGSIFIERDVTELVGFFTAQHSTTTRGKIVTCSPINSWNEVGEATLDTSCNRQLKVRGAFDANNVRYLRVANSMRDADSSSESSFSTSKAAESFLLGPEFFMIAPKDHTDKSKNKYDFFSALAPIL